LKFALAAKLSFISRWLAQATLSKQTDYAFRRGKDMLQKRLFYVFSHSRSCDLNHKISVSESLLFNLQ